MAGANPSVHPPSPASGDAQAAAPGGEARQDASARHPRASRLAAAVAVLVVIALAAALWRFGWAGLHGFFLHLNPAATVAAMAVLPLFGFSIAAVYVLAGAKFGLWGGGAVIVGLTAFHLLASHLISQTLLRARLQRWLARHQRHFPEIPHGEELSVSAMVALVPAVPYFAKNYLLALSGIPLRTYFSVCLPIYLVRSYVTLSLGDLTGGWSTRKLILLGAVYVVKLGICVWLFERIRQRIRAAHARDRAATGSKAPHGGNKPNVVAYE